MSFCNDNFAGTDGVDLSQHTSDSGHTWSNAGSFGSGGTILLDGNGGVFPGGPGATYVISATPTDADYDVQATFNFLSVKNNKTGVIGRSGYWLVYYSGASEWALHSNPFSPLATFPQTFTSGSRVAILRMRGTTISALVDGVTVMTVTDSTYTAAGSAGIIGLSIDGEQDFSGYHVAAFSATMANAPATGYTVSPSSSTSSVGYPSSNFTVSATGGFFNGTQTVTITSSVSGDTITPSVGSSGTTSVTVTPTAGSSSFSFTVTGHTTGSRTLTYTNGQSWTNASNGTLLVNQLYVILGPEASAPGGNGCEATFFFAKPSGTWNTAGLTENSANRPLFSLTDSTPASGTLTRTVAARLKSATVDTNGNLLVNAYLSPYGTSGTDPNWAYAPIIHAASSSITVTIPAAWFTDGNSNQNGSVTAAAVQNNSTIGYAKAIARPATFPNQRQTGSFDFYVKAKHIDGLPSVVASLTDSASFTQTLPAQTNVMWISDPASLGLAKGYAVHKFTFNAGNRGDSTPFAAGMATIKFTATPVIGDSSSIRNSNTDGINISVYLDPAGTAMPVTYAAISPTGVDAGGAVATSEAAARLTPFLTTKAAGAAIQSYNLAHYGNNNADAGVIVCEAGTYAYDGGTGSITTVNVPLTIRAATGVAPSAVIFSTGGVNGLNTLLVALQNVTLSPAAGQTSAIISTPTISGNQLFLDGVTMTGKGPADPAEYFFIAGSGNWSLVWAKHSTRQQNRYGWLVPYVFGCNANAISQSGMEDTVCVLDVTITDIDAGSTGFHTDVHIWFPGTDNCIIEGVHATGNVTPQGFFFNGQTMTNISVANVDFSGTSIQQGFKFSAGNGANTVSHFIAENCTMPSGMLVPSDDPGQLSSSFTLMSFRNCYFGSYSEDVTDRVDGAQFAHIGYEVSSPSTPGAYATTNLIESAQFVNSASENWHPSANSSLPKIPLAARQSKFDIGGTAFTDNSPAGAFEVASAGGGNSISGSTGVFHKRTKSTSLSTGVFRAR